MRKTFDWILFIEKKAADVYEQASQNANLGELYCQYLANLANEEREHKKLLEEAMEKWKEIPQLENEVVIDDTTAKEVQSALDRVACECQQSTIALDAIFNAIVTAEWSEWNNIFIYVMRRLAKEGLQGEKVTSLMERHKRRIIEFVELDQNLAGVCERLRNIEKIWKTRILVVEDALALRKLTSRVLSRLGQVETAEDGQVALELCKEKHFDAIVSDIDMPRVDGVEFFETLVAEQGDEIKKHFVFVTGAVDQKRKRELEALGVQVMLKPFEINDLKIIVSRLINQTGS